MIPKTLCFEPWATRADGALRFFGPAHWREVAGWDADARRGFGPARLVCRATPDVFEDLPELATTRLIGLWWTIHHTRHLRWEISTRLPKNIAALLPHEWRDGLPANLRVTVVSPMATEAPEGGLNS